MRIRRLIMAIACLIGMVLCLSQARTAQAISIENHGESVTITLNHNAYLYDENGIRLAKAGKLQKNQNVEVTGQITRLTQKRKYFLSYAYKRYWVPYTVINNYAYYKTLRNQYIKVANVKEINGNELIADSGSVIAKRNTVFYDKNADRTKLKVKKGQKIKVVAFVNLTPDWGVEHRYYRVTENKYLSVNDVIKPRIPLIYSWNK